MNLFFMNSRVGDVLLAQLTTTKPKTITAKSSGDVTLIYEEGTEQLLGFNLFNASTYLSYEKAGEVELTEEVITKLQAALEKNNVDVQLDVDFSPKFVVGHVLTKEKHPNADKLSVCSVNVGVETLQIVCGAANIEQGQKVVVAKVGAVMPSGMVIRDAELRGIPSSGMICSATELSLPEAQADAGILVLDESAVVGESFNK